MPTAGIQVKDSCNFDEGRWWEGPGSLDRFEGWVPGFAADRLHVCEKEMSQGWLKRLWLEYLRNDFEYKYNKAASQKVQAVHLDYKKVKI